MSREFIQTSRKHVAKRGLSRIITSTGYEPSGDDHSIQPLELNPNKKFQLRSFRERRKYLEAHLYFLVYDMTKEKEERIQQFSGRSTADYNLWRLRGEIALKGKGFWGKLNKEDCPEDTKEKAIALISASLGDAPFRVCSANQNDPMAKRGLLDKRYASDRATTRISTLKTVYSKQFSPNDIMAKYIAEFESLFSQMDRMGADVSLPDTHKGTLLLAIMGRQSPPSNQLWPHCGSRKWTN